MSDSRSYLIAPQFSSLQCSTDADDFTLTNTYSKADHFEFERIGSIKLFSGSYPGRANEMVAEDRPSSKYSEIEWVGQDYEVLRSLKHQILLTVREICWLSGVVEGALRVADFLDGKIDYMVEHSAQMLFRAYASPLYLVY